MKREPFTFYRALDPVQGSWDGYGYYPSPDHDFLAFVSDAPAGASIHTPELIKDYWTEYHHSNSVEQEDPEIARLHLADAVNRMQELLQSRSRRDGSTYQSTLTVVRKTGSRLLFCSVGDSILQVCRGRRLYRLTDNDVWDGALIMDDQQKSKNRQKTAPLRFVGYAGDFVRTTDVGTFRLESEDLLILQTDGVEDLLRPDQLLQILKGGFDDFRRHAHQVFQPGQLKDDVTMMIIPVIVSPEKDWKTEVASIHTEMGRLKSGHTEIRSEVKAQGQLQARLQSMEGTLQQISGKMQKLSEKIESRPEYRNVQTAQAGRSLPVFPMILTFLLGVLAGFAFLFLIKDGRSGMEPVPSRVRPAPKQIIAPPEIIPAAECIYVIQKGDSLNRIAVLRNVSIDNLLQWNPGLTKETPLEIGRELHTCGEIP